MQKQNYYITKKTKQIIVFLISLMYIICPKAPWNYSQCFNYLNTLGINCNKIIKNDNGDVICEKLDFPKINIPKECYNQKYKLEVNVNDSYKPNKQPIALFLKYDDKSTELNNNEENLDFSKKVVEECLKNYIIYHQKCLNEKFYENEDYCKELEALKDSNFCKSIVEDMTKKMQDKIQFELDDEISLDFSNVKFKFENDNNYYSFEINYGIFEEKVEDKDCIGNNKNEEHENELNEYSNNSGKDCIEYGLRSLKDNIIVCTKYE